MIELCIISVYKRCRRYLELLCALSSMKEKYVSIAERNTGTGTEDPNTAQGRITLFAKCAEGNLSLTYPKEKYHVAVPRNVQAKREGIRAYGNMELKYRPKTHKLEKS